MTSTKSAASVLERIPMKSTVAHVSGADSQLIQSQSLGQRREEEPNHALLLPGRLLHRNVTGSKTKQTG